ncbi:putative mRNA binding PUM-HD domain protein-like protein [Plasmodium gaboni]|uniref:Putative mRNA binding PUM-HD domain protein-like protein n=1 Tax=Plasmodium gaboni TaxID=647221 RepID=A0A151LRT9_9APIC|nr:putative mRNA binding PUM-HD domain protein-like protein [Plasmodium gaboni]KYO01905.1 putative mRNA binding PUM-HD domain protein-like protein [Plasmodium gaboni]
MTKKVGKWKSKKSKDKVYYNKNGLDNIKKGRNKENGYNNIENNKEKKKKKDNNKFVKYIKNKSEEKYVDRNDLKKNIIKGKNDINKNKNKKNSGKIKKERNNNDKYSIQVKYKNILNDENLSKSKKRKLIKEHRKKELIENYDYYKKLKIHLNDLLKSKNDKEEKKRQVGILYNELKKTDIDKFARTNLGYHIITSLIIYGNKDELYNKLFKYFYDKCFNDICTYHFISLIFQCFYNHGTDNIKNDIYLWLLKNLKSYLSKFGCRLWHIVFKKSKSSLRLRMVNSLIMPNMNEIKNISSEILKKPTKQMFESFSEQNQKALKKYIIEFIENIVEKEMLYNMVSHNIILVACEILDEEELINLMDIIHEGCEYLITTYLGNNALIYLLGYSTNKHKKILIKILKNDIIDLCKNSVNFLLIIRLLKITDDTKILNEFIVKKITTNLEDILNDYYGFYVILEFFYNIEQDDKDKFLYVEWKHLIYSKAPKSVKDGEKRKNEIIKPIIDQLQLIFKEKNKLNKYLKDKKYIVLIYEYLSHAELCDEVLNNLFGIMEQCIEDIKNGRIQNGDVHNDNDKNNNNNININNDDDNISLVYVKNIIGLFIRIFKSTNNTNLAHKIIDNNKLYKKITDLFLLNLQIILKSDFIKLFNSLILFLKENDNNIYEQVISTARSLNNNDIYEELKKTLPNVNHFCKYLELVVSKE